MYIYNSFIYIVYIAFNGEKLTPSPPPNNSFKMINAYCKFQNEKYTYLWEWFVLFFIKNLKNIYSQKKNNIEYCMYMNVKSSQDISQGH